MKGWNAVKNLKDMIDNELAQTNDVDRLRQLIVALVELADRKGATEAEMKEMFRKVLNPNA